MFAATLCHPELGRVDAKPHRADPKLRAQIRFGGCSLEVTNASGEVVSMDSKNTADFEAFLNEFDRCVTGNNPLRLVALLHERAPRAQFVSPRVESMLLDTSFQWRSSVAGFYYSKDMTGLSALLLFFKVRGQHHVAIKPDPERFPTARHIAGAWWGFDNPEDAILVKLGADIESKVFEVE